MGTYGGKGTRWSLGIKDKNKTREGPCIYWWWQCVMDLKDTINSALSIYNPKEAEGEEKRKRLGLNGFLKSEWMKKYYIVNSGYNVPIIFVNVIRLKCTAWSLIWKRSLNARK